MKNQQNIMRRLTLAAGLVVALSSAHAQLRTWNGGGTDDLWSSAANWGGTAPGATGATLVFDGTTRLGPDNDIVTSLNGITFAASAGSFVLGGNTFTLNGNITNNSGVLQTIDNAMTLNAQRNIDAAHGDIRINGVIGETGGARVLTKSGTETLTLAGANTFTGQLGFLRGKILLDAGAGGSLAAGGDLFFGVNGAVTDVNQGGLFKASGASTGSTVINTGRRLYLGRSTGANRIVVDSNGGAGTTLRFSDFARLTAATDGFPSLNVNLTSPGSAFQLDAVGSFMTNGVSLFSTVTDSTKTGFATRDVGTGLVTRFTAMTALPTAGVTVPDTQANRYVSGGQTLTGDVAANSLTINGAAGTAELDGNFQLRTTAILMEENVGNYTIKTASVGNGFLTVHQYSTGTLMISANLKDAGGNYSGYTFTKTGPGALVFSGNATNIAGVADVQGGLLKLDGTLKDVGVVQVRDGATLSGSGEIGGGTAWIWSASNVNSGTRYTPVNVWSGGTLDASYSSADALEITGSLALDAGSTFQVDLVGGSFSALSVTNVTPASNIVTLNGDLKLTLGYAPILGEEIDLLTSTDGLITGTFATINGFAATPTFVMGSYEFGINYGPNRVWLETTAVPEPGTAMLLVLAGALAIVRRRR
ncbi:MAG: PEP-CTERM sorting domain-containing protein [Chthoniobacterales bacterium]|nr:PEP-CTERM sorting domain-containing protein [Chthoniobacterales bacterium]